MQKRVKEESPGCPIMMGGSLGERLLRLLFQSIQLPHDHFRKSFLEFSCLTSQMTSVSQDSLVEVTDTQKGETDKFDNQTMWSAGAAGLRIPWSRDSRQRQFTIIAVTRRARLLSECCLVLLGSSTPGRHRLQSELKMKGMALISNCKSGTS